MTRRNLVVALGLGVLGLGATALPARADHYDRYYGQRYYRGRNPEEVRRRAILRDRLIDLGDRVRLAERHGDISRRQADRLYDRLDRVRDFLRHDSYLTDSEFDRRADDLRDVARDLREWCGSRYSRYRSRDYEDWYYSDRRPRGRDRYDDRYYRR